MASNIIQNLAKILSSRYGKDVRQAIHDSIHDCYEDGKAGATDLVAREQIANLVAENNPTEGNSELIDTRVGYDGTTYASVGEAVRRQVGSLSEDLNALRHIIGMRNCECHFDINNKNLSISKIKEGAGSYFFTDSRLLVTNNLPIEFDLSALSKSSTYAIVYDYSDHSVKSIDIKDSNIDLKLNKNQYVIAILYVTVDPSSGKLTMQNIYTYTAGGVFVDGVEYFLSRPLNDVINNAYKIPDYAIGVRNAKFDISTSDTTLSIGFENPERKDIIIWFYEKYYRYLDDVNVSYSDYFNQTAMFYIDENRVLKCGGMDEPRSDEEKNILFTVWFRNDGRVVTINCPNYDIKKCIYVDNVPYFQSDDSLNRYIENDKIYGASDIGCLDYEDIGETDYSHIILYGQSLSMGWECPEVITTEPVKNTYMIGSSPMINHGNDESLTLNPLKAVKWSSGGEQPIVSMTNAFAKMYNRFVDRNQKFIGTNCGEGGRSIERLMKQCTNGTNYYTTEFLDCINSAKSACDNVGKTISCSAIIYMQGEYNYTSLSGAGLTPGTDATSDKDIYKEYLLQLKNDMQNDIMEKYGQNKKPLFFIYQVAGNYINNKEMSINMAQVEFAEENEDVILLNSTYGMPDYSGGHLSTNGYRWYGELVAKQLYEVFVNGVSYKAVKLEDISISDNLIELYFYVPVLPLVFDSYTKESIKDNGFRIYMNGSDVLVSKMEISGNKVMITTESNLSGTIEITYGGQGRNGSGNLRDNDKYISMYTYYDDRETSPDKRELHTPTDKEGVPIYGKHYPMFNWCNQFYKKIVV